MISFFCSLDLKTAARESVARTDGDGELHVDGAARLKARLPDITYILIYSTLFTKRNGST